MITVRGILSDSFESAFVNYTQPKRKHLKNVLVSVTFTDVIGDKLDSESIGYVTCSEYSDNTPILEAYLLNNDFLLQNLRTEYANSKLLKHKLLITLDYVKDGIQNLQNYDISMNNRVEISSVVVECVY